MPNLHPLAVARERERFTQRQLSELTGVRHVRIAEFERGLTRPSTYEAKLLAACLRVPLADLLPPPPQPTTEAEVRDGDT